MVLSRTTHEVNKYQAGYELTKDLNDMYSGLRNIVVVSGSYSVTPSDSIVVMRNSGTATLPDIDDVPDGKIYTILNADTTAAASAIIPYDTSTFINSAAIASGSSVALVAWRGLSFVSCPSITTTSVHASFWTKLAYDSASI